MLVNKRRTLGDRARDAVLVLLSAIVALQVLPGVFAAWDASKPATNSALVSSEIRANWTSLQTALGNPDTVPLAPPVAINFAGALQAQSSTATQFFVSPTYKPGGDSSVDATVNGLLSGSVDTTQRANSGTGLTTLSTYNLPASTLNTNGRMVKCTAWGTFAANANTKTLSVKFGATTATLQNGGINGGAYTVTMTVIRTGAATQKMNSIGLTRSGGADTTDVSSAPTETLTGAITILTQGQSGTASSDILQEAFYCEVIGV